MNPLQVIYCRLISTEAVGDRGYCTNTPFIENVISFSHFLLAVNSSANFIIYTWRGARFRQELLALLCGPCHRRSRGSSRDPIQRNESGNGGRGAQSQLLT